MIAPLSFMGIGLGFCAAPLSASIISSVSSKHHGLAVGINSTCARVASALGVALLGSLALQKGSLNFGVLTITAAILCSLALPTTLLFPSKTKRDRKHEP